MRSISTSDWAKEEYTEPEQDQVLFHRLFPEWVPCISLHRHYRLSERGIYGELPLPENEISSKQGKRSCDGFPCLCWHWPIFPSRRQPSIFGTAELNFRVRNGNGWTLCVKSTDFISNQYSIYRLPTLHGAPSGIRTRDPLIKSQLLYQLS